MMALRISIPPSAGGRARPVQSIDFTLASVPARQG
jgi:hypothetical protein